MKKCEGGGYRCSRKPAYAIAINDGGTPKLRLFCHQHFHEAIPSTMAWRRLQK